MSAASDPGELPVSPTTPRLLIVDDVAENRAILTRRFQRRGYEIVEASDGFRALELVAEQAFDLVLLDVMMPGIDGLEVLTRIREQHGPAALPVIMVTALAQNDDVVKALKLGANDYVTKPVDFAIALARTETQVARKHAEEAVQRANRALREANENLERRIAERTKELREANEQLKMEIVNRERSEATIRYQAHHDALTGLPNRVLFRKQLQEALVRARRSGEDLAVHFLDLDGFKNVNDTLGHAVGDELLKSIAGRLQNTVRHADKIARLGGDEFAVLQLAAELPSGAGVLAGRLIDAVKAPCVVDEHQILVGASIGIAVLRTDGIHFNPDDLLKSADLAMYRAKADGRGRFCFFEPEMDARAQARRSLELDLRRALAQRGFELHYQPLVNLQSDSVTAFEALLRWPHPEREWISPADFIPLAEETGLIVPLGDWVLRQACRDAATWSPDIKVAVNLSPIQFKAGDLVQSVADALTESGLAPQRLELEITESVLLDKTETSIAVLHRLRELGVAISLDDFGTGYSSLSYLRNFPFDKIKIDQSFVSHMAREHQSGAIVSAIAGLGDSFGIPTTAEGVETAEQLERLRAQGCTEVQGFLISRPIPASGIADLLTSYRAGRQAAA
ncbi:MAG TPA: EAL domain-containing protein [Beijerinckiaceae bacterium]|nr:EAL domain-containing protein [Beijerinckiaceae bacterium]